MNIAVVTSNYPYRSRPYCGAFVRELVWEFARQGNECKVIAPVSVWDRPRYGPLGQEAQWEQVPRSSAAVQVFRPRIMTFSSRQLGPWNSTQLSNLMFTRATAKALHKIPKSIDLLYAHFFYSAGLAAVRCARQMNIPVFVAHGDDSIEPWYLTKGKKHFRKVSGVVAVSSDNAHFCREMFGIPGSRIRMFPNGVDRTLFYPRDRNEARRRLHLPEGVPLVAFVGHFIPRKGPDRLLAALEGIDGVGALMIGEGPIGLSSTRIRFQGVVDHHELPWYLSAADLFVLPTTGEGSCNAILEAMACGLPIVSSDGSFNDDILTPEVALRVDPMDITALRQAVETLMKDPELRGSMGQRSLEWSANFRIEVRATCILDWMQALMKN